MRIRLLSKLTDVSRGYTWVTSRLGKTVSDKAPPSSDAVGG